MLNYVGSGEEIRRFQTAGADRFGKIHQLWKCIPSAARPESTVHERHPAATGRVESRVGASAGVHWSQRAEIGRRRRDSPFQSGRRWGDAAYSGRAEIDFSIKSLIYTKLNTGKTIRHPSWSGPWHQHGAESASASRSVRKRAASIGRSVAVFDGGERPPAARVSRRERRKHRSTAAAAGRQLGEVTWTVQDPSRQIDRILQSAALFRHCEFLLLCLIIL